MIRPTFVVALFGLLSAVSLADESCMGQCTDTLKQNVNAAPGDVTAFCDAWNEFRPCALDCPNGKKSWDYFYDETRKYDLYCNINLTAPARTQLKLPDMSNATAQQQEQLSAQKAFVETKATCAYKCAGKLQSDFAVDGHTPKLCRDFKHYVICMKRCPYGRSVWKQTVNQPDMQTNIGLIDAMCGTHYVQQAT